MASQSLYRKWRSQTFTEMVGQEEIVRTLKNALESGTLAHAYLFTGPRGTGKTSTARLLAKTINCPNSKDGEPCNECEQCREITIGSSLNVIEIDAASNRGIDNIRELRDKIKMPPSTGKYKVYILDEAHMLTNEAFNALLKTLEEPPPHAIFVMATTDVHKMLPTVLSRCQRFDFKRFTTRQIVKHLLFVAEQEQITLEGGAAELIARAAAGGMRDALSLLDQAIAYAGQQITLAQIQTMLGVADPRAIQKLITYVAELDSAAGLHLIHELSEAGADLRQINSQVGEYWRHMMLAKEVAELAAMIDGTEDEIREIRQTAQFFTLQELMEGARTFALNDLMQKNLGTPQLGLELAFLTCVEAHRRAQSGQPLSAAPSSPVVPSRPAPVHPVQGQPSTMGRPAPVRAPNPAYEMRMPPTQEQPLPMPPIASQSPPAKVGEEAAETLPDWEDVSSFTDDSQESEPVLASSPHTAPTTAAPSHSDPVALVADGEVAASNAEGSEGPALTVQQVREHWEYIKRRVKTKKDGSMIAALLNEYTIVSVEGTHEQPTVVIRANHDFHYKTLQKEDARRGIIEWAMKIELKQECRVRLLPPGQVIPPLPSPTSYSSDAPTRARDADNRPGAPEIQQTSQALPQAAPARREPLANEKPSSPPQKQTRPITGQQKKAQPPEARSTTVPASNGASSSPPLADTRKVSENSSKISPTARENQPKGETRMQFLEKKAKSDPVVQEVVRMFRAEIKEIQPK